jgi:hypothetical protein
MMNTESNREPYPDADDADYARGQDVEKPPTVEQENRFSEGQEQTPPDTPEKLAEGRFSEGQADLPANPPLEENRFSEGQEKLPRRD